MESALYIVATPIGNLKDITFRAVDVLGGVAVVAAEDTRHTKRLLDSLNIRAKMVSLHEHNEFERADSLLERVLRGESVALVSDAGTPLISDPGYILVEKAKARGVKVVPVPGPSAITAALSVSGVACGKFIFEGFLPAKTKAKRERIAQYEQETKTVVFYESPHRILATLEALADIYPNRILGIARELTKTFETVLNGNTRELLELVSSDSNQQKGEFVLVLEGAEKVERAAIDLDVERLLGLLLVELPPKKASAIVAEVLGVKKKDVYQLAISLKGG